MTREELESTWPRETFSGQPVLPELEDTPGVRFVILSLKWTKPGDLVLTWWRPDSRGYCYSLDDAGVYTRDDAMKIQKPGTAVAIEYSAAQAMVSKVVMVDKLPQPISYFVHCSNVAHSKKES